MEMLERRFTSNGEVYFVISANNLRRRFLWEWLSTPNQPIFGRWVIYQALRRR